MTDETDLTEFEQDLLNIIQDDFPLSKRPYEVLADKLGTSTQNVLETIADLRDRRIVRRIGPVYDVKANGLVSTLVAGKLDSDKIHRAKSVFAEYPGITHAYLRPCEFNLWFTVAAAGEEELETVKDEIEDRLDLDSLLDLPMERKVKLGVQFDV